MIEQEARDAVVEACDREAYLAFNGLPEVDRTDVLAGVWDQTTGMQIFARHRIAAKAEQREADAKVADRRAEQFAADGLQHPADSESRSRCFARSRAAAYVATDIRKGE